MNPHDKLASARLLAVNRMPYFRTAILSLLPRQAPGLGTFGVTRNGIMLWDPAAIEAWTVREAAGVIIHEALHLMRNHADRREAMGADPKAWNCAADLEINDDLQAAKLDLPGDGLFPDKVGMEEGLTAEEYYHLLPRQPSGDGDQGDPQQGGQQREGDDEGKDGDGEQGQGNSVAEALGVEPGVGAGECGGCAGNPMDAEADIPDEAPGRSDAELARIRRQTAEAVRQEAEKGRGNVPGSLVRWADAYLSPPKVSWQQKLQRAVRGAIAYRAGAVDMRYNWPSRRQAGIGYGMGRPVLPALRAPVPRVAVAVDTSGSMGTDELQEAVAECNGILKTVGAEIDFVACDCRIQDAGKVRHWKQLVDRLKGGGGTDFRPIMERFNLQRPRPDIVVVATDGCGPAPAEEPPYKVIWLLVGPYKRPPCDWGEQIELTDE